jgi:hypothetical protein
VRAGGDSAPVASATAECGAMSGWLPIKSAPKDGTVVLLWHEPSRSVNVGFWQDIYTEHWHASVIGHPALWSDCDGPQPIFEATHWMPLPEPPR